MSFKTCSPVPQVPAPPRQEPKAVSVTHSVAH